jgi:hypothetical protein
MNNAVDNIQKEVIARLYEGTILVAGDASELYAPKGHTLQLSRGIRALKPVVNSDGTVIGRIISSARSKSGYDYAERQHNVVLRHYSEQPLRLGYTDAGTGRTSRARYRSGYLRLKDSSPKYATEYLNKALEGRRAQIVQMLTQAMRDA